MFMRTEGRRTDMTKLIFAFRNFANAPKIPLISSIIQRTQKRDNQRESKGKFQLIIWGEKNVQSSVQICVTQMERKIGYNLYIRVTVHL